MSEKHTKTISVEGTEITILQIDDTDYICITDMLKAKDGDFVVCLFYVISGLTFSVGKCVRDYSSGLRNSCGRKVIQHTQRAKRRKKRLSVC